MRKFLAMLLALSMVFLVVSCSKTKSAEADKSSVKVYKFKLGTDCSNPEISSEYNGYGHAIAKFVELVEEKTGGKVIVEPYYESVLGNQAELFTQVRDGELDMFYGTALSSFDSRFAFKGLPFLFKDFDQVHRLMANPEGKLYKIYSDLLAEYGVNLLGQGIGTFRGLANNKHKIATVEDMSDITLRIYQDKIVQGFYSPICNASVIPFSEAYTALQTKTADAIELAASIIVMAKFYEVVDYYSDLDWQLMSQGFMISDKALNSLPSDLKDIVRECSWEACEFEREIEIKDRQFAMDSLRDLGCEVYELSDAERAGWIKYARTLKGSFRDYVGAETYNKVMSIVENDKL